MIYLYLRYVFIRDSVLWVWIYQGEEYPLDAVDEVMVLFISLTIEENCIQPHNFIAWLQIRFKVHSVNYPSIPIDHGQDSEQNDVKPFAPMVVSVSLL